VVKKVIASSNCAFIGDNGQFFMYFNDAKRFYSMCQLRNFLETELDLYERHDKKVRFWVYAVDPKKDKYCHYVMEFEINPKNKKAFRLLKEIMNG
jgi:hypothetical protein